MLRSISERRESLSSRTCSHEAPRAAHILTHSLPTSNRASQLRRASKFMKGCREMMTSSSLEASFLTSRAVASRSSAQSERPREVW